MNYKKIGIIFLLCIVVAMGFPSDRTLLSRAEITSASIKDKQNQINAAEKEKELQNNEVLFLYNYFKKLNI